MNWRVLGMLLPILALLGCAAPPKDPQTLAAQAADGDAVAACKLAMLDLRHCTAERDAWLHSGGPGPTCMQDAVPAEHEAYLASAVSRMMSTDGKRRGQMAVDATVLMQLTLLSDPRGKIPTASIVDSLDDFDQFCHIL